MRAQDFISSNSNPSDIAGKGRFRSWLSSPSVVRVVNGVLAASMVIVVSTQNLSRAFAAQQPTGPAHGTTVKAPTILGTGYNVDVSGHPTNPVRQIQFVADPQAAGGRKTYVSNNGQFLTVGDGKPDLTGINHVKFIGDEKVYNVVRASQNPASPDYFRAKYVGPDGKGPSFLNAVAPAASGQTQAAPVGAMQAGAGGRVNTHMLNAAMMNGTPLPAAFSNEMSGRTQMASAMGMGGHTPTPKMYSKPLTPAANTSMQQSLGKLTAGVQPNSTKHSSFMDSEGNKWDVTAKMDKHGKCTCHVKITPPEKPIPPVGPGSPLPPVGPIGPIAAVPPLPPAPPLPPLPPLPPEIPHFKIKKVVKLTVVVNQFSSFVSSSSISDVRFFNENSAMFGAIFQLASQQPPEAPPEAAPPEAAPPTQVAGRRPGRAAPPALGAVQETVAAIPPGTCAAKDRMFAQVNPFGRVPTQAESRRFTMIWEKCMEEIAERQEILAQQQLAATVESIRTAKEGNCSRDAQLEASLLTDEEKKANDGAKVKAIRETLGTCQVAAREYKLPDAEQKASEILPGSGAVGTGKTAAVTSGDKPVTVAMSEDTRGNLPSLLLLAGNRGPRSTSGIHGEQTWRQIIPANDQPELTQAKAEVVAAKPALSNAQYGGQLVAANEAPSTIIGFGDERPAKPFGRRIPVIEALALRAA